MGFAKGSITTLLQPQHSFYEGRQWLSAWACSLDLIWESKSPSRALSPQLFSPVTHVLCQASQEDRSRDRLCRGHSLSHRILSEEEVSLERRSGAEERESERQIKSQWCHVLASCQTVPSFPALTDKDFLWWIHYVNHSCSKEALKIRSNTLQGHL